ncbi:hypothetical protein DF143_32690 [Burkholderia cenocepacia]|nr:hypothetical protein DF143_32690 [Burkholderia cenocepacia]RQV35053.1 hypothetical protein DF033_32015 [Burkholderia cenocepacia]
MAEEVPSHLSFEIHWLDADDFTVFRQTYDRWQIDGRPKGDLSYALLDLLSIGGAPVDRREGVGVMHIATDAEKAELERLTHPLKRRDLTERLIFHVPITEDQP